MRMQQKVMYGGWLTAIVLLWGSITSAEVTMNRDDDQRRFYCALVQTGIIL